MELDDIARYGWLMSRNSQFVSVCITLPDSVLKKLDEKAQHEERPRSFVARKIFERAFADSVVAKPSKETTHGK